MNRNQRVILLIGLLLIIAGIVLVALQLAGLPVDIGIWIPLVAGLLCCFAGVFSHEAVLFFPGGLLTGAGVGLVIANSTLAASPDGLKAAVVLVSFSAGWLLVTLLSRLFSQKTYWWPLLPGLVGVIVGIVLTASA